MPKIEVTESILAGILGRRYPHHELEQLLTVAKAELDGVNEEEGVLKIELNDTNRPDLWSSAGLGRQLRCYLGTPAADYTFFSTPSRSLDAGGRAVLVEPDLKEIRPYIAAFAVTGKPIDSAMLKDLIQTQEKLCWNYGRKRSSIAMGVYRADLIKYPVHYSAVSPTTTKFQPLGMEEVLSLEEILEGHPKGREYGQILKQFQLYPYLTDDTGNTLSFPPIINSARIGAVQEGDSELFIEMTGTDLPSLTLAASIVACDLSDFGYEILPVEVHYPYDTPFGRTITTPCYFQEGSETTVEYVNRLLGTELGGEEMVAALGRMGVAARVEEARVIITVPEYRNDFLHQSDIAEDVAIGIGLDSFEPEMPRDYTQGGLTTSERTARKVRRVMTGLGFQEMIYNYLGSGRDFIDKMEISGEELVRVANPMSENYEYLRASILPALLKSEVVSANGVYPHNIFEIGKVAYLDDSEVTGTTTRNYLGLLSADRAAGFTQINSTISALFFYTKLDYQLEPLLDPRFIPGRCAAIVVGGRRVGYFGEIHPKVLENWGIVMPVSSGEMDLGLMFPENDQD